MYERSLFSIQPIANGFLVRIDIDRNKEIDHAFAVGAGMARGFNRDEVLEKNVAPPKPKIKETQKTNNLHYFKTLKEVFDFIDFTWNE